MDLWLFSGMKLRTKFDTIKFIFDVFDDQIYTDIFEASEKDISNNKDYQANIRTAIKYIFSLIKQFGHYSEKEYRFSIEETDLRKIDFEAKRGELYSKVVDELV